MHKTIGILAHVDAGKTTFSEQLLFHTKTIRQRGRVDHKDSFLDSHLIEKIEVLLFSLTKEYFLIITLLIMLSILQAMSTFLLKWSGPFK